MRPVILCAAAAVLIATTIQPATSDDDIVCALANQRAAQMSAHTPRWRRSRSLCCSRWTTRAASAWRSICECRASEPGISNYHRF
jgi:hypothetical protein